MSNKLPVNQNRFFHAFYWIVEVCWYFNFLLIVVALYFLSRSLFGEADADFSALIRLNTPLSSIPVPGAAIEAQDATIRLRIPNNTWYIISAFVFFFLFEALVISALFNIRRVLRSLGRQSPFTSENIRRLRYTALFIGLLAPFNFLLSIVQAEIVNTYVPKAEQTFRMNWNVGLPYLVVAAVIYIMVDVFRYGMRLQQENEAFV